MNQIFQYEFYLIKPEITITSILDSLNPVKYAKREFSSPEADQIYELSIPYNIDSIQLLWQSHNQIGAKIFSKNDLEFEYEIEIDGIRGLVRVI